MAKTPPVPLTKAEEKLEIKLRKMLRDKKFKETKIALKKLNANSAGRKMLRAVFGFGLRMAGSRLLWLGALGYAGFQYGPELWDKLTDEGVSDDERNQAIDDITNAFPDRDPLVDVDEFVDVPAYRTPVSEIPRGEDPLQARTLSQAEMEDASLALQEAVVKGEAAQEDESYNYETELQYSPGVRRARSEAQQMLPTGTFARGQGEPVRGMLDRRLGDQYTPSGNIGLVEEKSLWPDRVIGPRPQPVETPWAEGGAAYGLAGEEAQAERNQLSLESLWEQRKIANAVAAAQGQEPSYPVPSFLPEHDPRLSTQERVRTGDPSAYPQPVPEPSPTPIPPTIPGMETGPEETMEGQRGPEAYWTGKQYERMPTTEEAAAGAFDFPDLLERITDEEALVAEAQGIEDGRPGPFVVAGEVGKATWNIGKHGPQAFKQVYDYVTGKWTDSEDATEELDVSTGIVLDASGNILSTGEVAPKGDVSTISASAKEGLKEQSKREVVQTNVDATVNKYNLSPPIGQALSQIEKNAGILRAASVMMGVKDISSNYRDMSIGQLRLARDIVEDLNGGQGPWKTWWSPDGSQQENLPIKGGASKPKPGWVDTNPVPRLTGAAKLVQSAKQKIKDGQPWSAYQDAIDYEIAGGFTLEQKHIMTADLITAWMREHNPALTSSFKWPTRAEYDLWENRKMTDEQFKGFFGFTFQR